MHAQTSTHKHEQAQSQALIQTHTDVISCAHLDSEEMLLCHRLYAVELVYLLAEDESLTSSGPHCTFMLHVSVSLALRTVVYDLIIPEYTHNAAVLTYGECMSVVSLCNTV